MVRKSMRYGVLEAYLDDPIMGRTDLTGLHLRCTTIMVRVGGRAVEYFLRFLLFADLKFCSGPETNYCFSFVTNLVL